MENKIELWGLNWTTEYMLLRLANALSLHISMSIKILKHYTISLSKAMLKFTSFVALFNILPNRLQGIDLCYWVKHFVYADYRQYLALGGRVTATKNAHLSETNQNQFNKLTKITGFDQLVILRYFWKKLRRYWMNVKING